MEYAAQKYGNFRVQQGIIQTKRLQLTAFVRALEFVSSEGSGPWDDEQSTRFLSEFCMGMGDSEDTNYAAQRYADQQLTSTTLEVESTKNRGQYLN